MNDGTLKELWRQVAEQKTLRAKLDELQAQRRALAGRLSELDRERRAEQADVDRLEGRSLAAFFFQVMGTREEKLDRERQEAYAARVRYDAAARELESVERDAAGLEARLQALAGCERRYQEALLARVGALKAAAGPAAQELMECETRMETAQLQQQEIDEAIRAGRGARQAADAVLDALDSAAGWSRWDVVGGGLLADMAKYSRLDEAQEQVERLQVELRRFKTELADVEINADLQVEVEGFLRFADIFFDNLLTDWAVLDHINQAGQQVQRTRRQIERVLTKLKKMKADLRSQIEDERERQEQIALRDDR